MGKTRQNSHSERLEHHVSQSYTVIIFYGECPREYDLLKQLTKLHNYRARSISYRVETRRPAAWTEKLTLLLFLNQVLEFLKMFLDLFAESQLLRLILRLVRHCYRQQATEKILSSLTHISCQTFEKPEEQYKDHRNSFCLQLAIREKQNNVQER